MNEQQFNLLAEKLIKRPEQREAVRTHIMGGLIANEAERRAYGTVTNTVGRDGKRIKAEFEFINEFIRLGHQK